MMVRAGRSLMPWVSLIAASLVALGATPAAAEAVRYSTSGQVALGYGTIPLQGVTDVALADDGKFLSFGSIPSRGQAGGMMQGDFRVRFDFREGLPSIDVAGTIGWVGYNFDMPAIDPVVTTSATAAEIARYPAVFRDLLAHPDWLHTSSFNNGVSPVIIGASVHVEDPNELRPVPEPSTLLAFGLALAGVGWRAARRSA